MLRSWVTLTTELSWRGWQFETVSPACAIYFVAKDKEPVRGVWVRPDENPVLLLVGCCCCCFWLVCCLSLCFLSSFFGYRTAYCGAS